MQDRKIIYFELNEVPFRIIDEFARWRPKSALASHLADCTQFVTHTDTRGQRLSPWVTWPNVHRGVEDATHEIHHFGQDLGEADAEYPPIWQILARAGVSTGVFGSLHTYPMPEQLDGYLFYVPDTFAAGSECFPKEVSAFQELSLAMTRRSNRNVDTTVPWKAALNFLTKLPELGLKPRTLVDAGRQLLDEKITPERRVRRRTYQAVIAFDVFMRQLAKTRPDFTTFFTNHVASSMHRYWAARFPQDYDLFEQTPEWIEMYANEIEFAMQKFDGMFARLVRFVDRNPDYTLWITTSMGQAATAALLVETRVYVTDMPRFMARLGVEHDEWHARPAMEPQRSVIVNESKRQLFENNLKGLMFQGKPIDVGVKKDGFFSISLGHPNLHLDPQFAMLHGKEVAYEELGVECVDIEDKTNANAFHIQTGTLLVYDPKSRPTKGNRPQISALEIAPTILRNYGVSRPSYMQPPVSPQ